MLKYNKTNADFLNQFTELIFQYKYSSSEERLKVIAKLKDFNRTFAKQLKDYGLDFYIEKLLLLSNSITNKAPESLINWIENYAIQLQIGINEESPQPFSNINLVASFCFSSLLTILLAFVSVIE